MPSNAPSELGLRFRRLEYPGLRPEIVEFGHLWRELLQFKPIPHLCRIPSRFSPFTLGVAKTSPYSALRRQGAPALAQKTRIVTAKSRPDTTHLEAAFKLGRSVWAMEQDSVFLIAPVKAKMRGKRGNQAKYERGALPDESETHLVGGGEWKGIGHPQFQSRNAQNRRMRRFKTR